MHIRILDIPAAGFAGRAGDISPVRCIAMWQKPEFEVVEVTMEVTAYVARR